VKVPRFAFEKFPSADATLTTTMKSVGEADGDRPQLLDRAAEGAAIAREARSSFHWGDEPRSVSELLEVAKVPTDGAS
jgi:carbamoyl-phosphate synthase large subunit